MGPNIQTHRDLMHLSRIIHTYDISTAVFPGLNQSLEIRLFAIALRTLVPALTFAVCL